MTDKIYGGHKPACVGTLVSAAHDGACEVKQAHAEPAPIEDTFNRANNTVDRLFKLSDMLYGKLTVYMKQSTNECNPVPTPVESPTSVLGQALYSLEGRLRALEYQLEHIHDRIEL